MVSRLELHELLLDILGSNEVYYQPPASVQMTYPAIVYSRKDIDNYHADNGVYMQFTGYEITVIDRNPDSEYVIAVSKLSGCRYDRHFTKDNLNHDVFVLY